MIFTLNNNMRKAIILTLLEMKITKTITAAQMKWGIREWLRPRNGSLIDLTQLFAWMFP